MTGCILAFVRSGITLATTLPPRCNIPITTALPAPPCNPLPPHCLSQPQFFALVHVPGLAADESFINFNLTAKVAAAEFILHGESATLEHEPSGLLGDLHGPVDCPRRDT